MANRISIPHIASSEITPEAVYLKRRDFMRAAGIAALPALSALSALTEAAVTGGAPLNYKTAASARGGFNTNEGQTPYSDVTSYCNFYEFGTDKGDPPRFAHQMTVDP
jgi:sulfoxide reductase catalytic subunit YedY